jgi:ABC-type glycerol-3-phosphate transport system permease component
MRNRLWRIPLAVVAATALVASAAGRVFFDSLAGYALARLRFRGRDGVFATVLAVLAVPGVVLFIPKFLVLNRTCSRSGARAG